MVVVQQLNGADPLVDKLARPLIDRQKYPSMHTDDGWQAQIRALVAAELVQKLRTTETIENPATARLGGPSAAEWRTKSHTTCRMISVNL